MYSMLMRLDSESIPTNHLVLWFSREKELARSARDAHLHKALFLPGGLEDGTELGYYTNTEVSSSYLLLFLLHYGL